MITNTEIRNVPCKDRTIEYYLTKKAVKNINLRIKHDGRILVSASKAVPVDYIDDFVRKKQEFIIKALEEYEKNPKYTSPVTKEYISGESFDILGKSLSLKVSKGSKEAVWADDVFIYLIVKNENNLSHKEKMIDGWLKKLQIETFEQICTDTYQIFKKYNVPYKELKIRCMRSRWGSCQPRKGIITLNSKLIEVPRHCIEYVVLHEFAHFIHPNHSKNFYNFVEKLMPDWKERKMELMRR